MVGRVACVGEVAVVLVAVRGRQRVVWVLGTGVVARGLEGLEGSGMAVQVAGERGVGAREAGARVRVAAVRAAEEREGEEVEGWAAGGTAGKGMVAAEATVVGEAGSRG